MDRCGLFIDAGYLFAAGGVLTTGHPGRSRSTCDIAELIAGLRYEIQLHGQLPLMRAYWYDGAPLAVPTTEQTAIGKLRGVKLRLGRLSGGRQKGVDALIYRDMMTLARERALVRAYLLSGDDDLREGMLAAQDMGVEVVLLGIPTATSSNQHQAESLVMEADEHLVLPAQFWLRYFRIAHPTPQAVGTRAGEPQRAAEGPAQTFEITASAAGTVNRVEDDEAEPLPAVLEQDAHTAGLQFGTDWATRAGAAGTDDVLKARPRIPPKLDLQLLLFVESATGALKGRQSLRKAARAGFWRALKERRRALREGASLTGRGSLFDGDQPCGEAAYHLVIVEPRQDSVSTSNAAAVVEGHLVPQGGQRTDGIVGRQLTLRLEDGRRLDLVLQDVTGRIRPGELGLYRAADPASQTADEIHGRVLKDKRERDLDAVATVLNDRCLSVLAASVKAFQSRAVLSNASDIQRGTSPGAVIALENGSGYRGATSTVSAFRYTLHLAHDPRSQVAGWCQVEVPEASAQDPLLRLRWVAQYPEGGAPQEVFRVGCSTVEAGGDALDRAVAPRMQELLERLMPELNAQDQRRRGER